MRFKRRELWFVMGDFNSVASLNEKKGAVSSGCNEDISCFQDFISEAQLIDLPFIGRRYTWYKQDGYSMSRTDSNCQKRLVEQMATFISMGSKTMSLRSLPINSKGE